MNRVAKTIGNTLGLRSIGRFEHGVSAVRQEGQNNFAKGSIVFHEKDGFRPLRGVLHARHLVNRGIRVAGAWKKQCESSAMIRFTADANGAAALLDHSIHGREAEPGAFAAHFGGEEGFENVRSSLAVHASSGVAHGQ